MPRPPDTQQEEHDIDGGENPSQWFGVRQAEQEVIFTTARMTVITSRMAARVGAIIRRQAFSPDGSRAKKATTAMDVTVINTSTRTRR